MGRAVMIRKPLARAAALVLALAAGLVAVSCKSPLGADLDRWQRAYNNRWDPTTMVEVPGGTMTLGVNGWSADAGPAHDVTLSTFYMSAGEITQSIFQYYMGYNPSYHVGSDLPVEQVTWLEAVEFCNAVSQSQGLQPAYTIDYYNEKVTWNTSANGFRLPTEAEWEYAAWGGPYSGWHWYAGSDNLDLVAWVEGDSANATHPVAQLVPNELGLYDMTGNVWEFCWDQYDASFYSWNTDWTNPAGPYASWVGYSSAWSPVFEPVIRGSSYNLSGYDSGGYEYAAIPYRAFLSYGAGGASALEYRHYVGFRVAMNGP